MNHLSPKSKLISRGLYTLRVLVLFGLFNTFAWQSNAAAAGSSPIVQYSDIWDSRFMEVLTGFYDVTYFNAVIPYGSKVFLHYGFEESCYRSQNPAYGVCEIWQNSKTVELKQWEEFGWVTRVSQVVYRRGVTRYVTGLDFYLEIRKPDQQTIFVRGGELEGNYFRAVAPDMSTCEDLGHDKLKICAVTLSVAVKP